MSTASREHGSRRDPLEKPFLIDMLSGPHPKFLGDPVLDPLLSLPPNLLSPNPIRTLSQQVNTYLPVPSPPGITSQTTPYRPPPNSYLNLPPPHFPPDHVSPMLLLAAKSLDSSLQTSRNMLQNVPSFPRESIKPSFADDPYAGDGYPGNSTT